MTACTGSVRCLAGAAGCISPACLCTASGLGQVLLAGLLPSGRASFKDCMLSPLPSISKNLTGQEFHGAAYHDPEDKTRRYNKQSYGRCQAWGHDFLGHRFGWGPHRFACLSHPCRVSGPFLINLIVLNSDGGSHVGHGPFCLGNDFSHVFLRLFLGGFGCMAVGCARSSLLDYRSGGHCPCQRAPFCPMTASWFRRRGGATRRWPVGCLVD